MKKIAIIGLCLLLTGGVYAEGTTKGKTQWTAMRLMTAANKLQRQQQYLEAMDSATLVLTVDPDSRAAKEFVHSHWDQMMRSAQKTLEENHQENNLEQARRRLQVYRYLVEINDNLRMTPLPLHGVNDRWVWQPEVQYWDGHFNDELRRVYRLEEEEKKYKANAEAHRH